MPWYEIIPNEEATQTGEFTPYALTSTATFNFQLGYQIGSSDNTLYTTAHLEKQNFGTGHDPYIYFSYRVNEEVVVKRQALIGNNVYRESKYVYVFNSDIGTRFYNKFSPFVRECVSKKFPTKEYTLTEKLPKDFRGSFKIGFETKRHGAIEGINANGPEIYFIKRDNHSEHYTYEELIGETFRFVIYSDPSYPVESPTEFPVEFVDWLLSGMEEATPTTKGIFLYYNGSEKNRVDKTPYLRFVGDFDGKLREPCDIVNPSFLVNIPLEYANSTYNYLYSAEFDRYYFINSITVFRNNLVRLDCSTDVLMSYQESIKNLKVSVSRQENEYSRYLPDTKLPITTNPFKEIIDVSFKAPNPILNPLEFSSNSYCVALTVAAHTDRPNNKAGVTMGTTATYVLTLSQFDRLAKKIIDDNVLNDINSIWSSIDDAIMNISIFPIDFESALADNQKNYKESITIGNRIIDLRPAVTTGEYSGILVENLGTLSIDMGWFYYADIAQYKNFLDGNRYTKYQLFLPFYGYTDIDGDMLFNSDIHIILDVDLRTAKGVYRVGTYVQNNSTGQAEATDTYILNCNVGFAAPLSGSALRDSMNNAITGAIGLVGGAVATAATGGAALPLAIGAGASAASIVSGVNTTATGGTFNGIGWEKGNLSDKSKLLITRTASPIYNSPSYYASYRSLYGAPSTYIGLLGDLTGYTEVDSVHVEEIPCTEQERLSIENTLKSGVIL